MKKVLSFTAMFSLATFVFLQLALADVTILKTLEEQVAPKGAAIIIIDMQNDFVADQGVTGKGGGNVKRVQKIVPKLNDFITNARMAGVPVIWVTLTHSMKDVLPAYLAPRAARVEKKGEKFTDANFITQEGTWGAELYSEMLKPIKGELQLRKHGYGAFTGTPLDMNLKALGIQTLIVTGTNTNACCFSTALQAHHLGYYPIMVSDCNETPDAEFHEPILKNFHNRYGYVATSEEIVKVWKKK